MLAGDIRAYCGKIRDLMSTAPEESTFAAVKRLLGEIRTRRSAVKERSAARDALQRDISSIKDRDVRQAQESKERATELLGKLRADLENAIKVLNLSRTTLNDIDRQIKGNKSKQKRLEILQRKKEYVERIAQLLAKRFKSKEEGLLQKLDGEVQDHFKCLCNAPLVPHIDANYVFTMTADNELAKGSKSQNFLASIATIAAIVAIGKEQAVARQHKVPTNRQPK